MYISYSNNAFMQIKLFAIINYSYSSLIRIKNRLKISGVILKFHYAFLCILHMWTIGVL